MADEQTTTTGTDGIARTTDGTIADQGTPQSKETTTEQKTETTLPKTEQSNDGKSVLNQKAEGEKKEEPPAKGAPEKYEDFKAPEGVKLDPVVIAKALPIFKELGLPQEGAQKLVDMYRELTAEAQAAPYKAYQDTVADWLKQSQDHPDLRGKLAPGGEVNVRIGKLLDGVPDAKLASDFREAMDITGVGNHPAFIRMMDHFAKQLTEGTHVAGNGPSRHGQSAPGASTEPGAAAAMWPKLPSASDRR
jgi:hypothetical protein